MQKLILHGVRVPRPGLMLIAYRNGDANSPLCLDNAQVNVPGAPQLAYPIVRTRLKSPSFDVPVSDIWHAPLRTPRIEKATNIAAYISWGGNGAPPYGNSWAYDGTFETLGASAWWLCQSVESWNGLRDLSPHVSFQGSYGEWFTSASFGGAGYPGTPVGGVHHTREPGIGGCMTPQFYLGCGIMAGVLVSLPGVRQDSTVFPIPMVQFQEAQWQ